MKKKAQRIVVILLAAALLIGVLTPAIAIFARASITQGDIENIKDQLSSVADRKKDAQKRLDAIRDDLEEAEEAVDLVQSQVLLTEEQIGYIQDLIDATQGEIDASQAQIDAYDAQIEQKEADILELEAQEAEQRQEFYRQVRWMEETGPVSYLSILFEASSFSEMLDYAVLIGDIMDYSNRIIRRLESTQGLLADARNDIQADRDAQARVQEQLEEQKAEQEGQRAELEAQKAQLDRDKAEATALMNKIAASESEYAAEVKKLAAQEAEVERALKAAEEKYAQQLVNMNYTGDWYWPLPNRYNLSSLFGPRYLEGAWQSHSGTDIPAPAGTQIHAAQGGIVTYVSSNKNGSYGWYCMISHGGGYVTLYAHQRVKPIVQEGQTVSRGQVIGYVGTTGSSTGNHLHFELRINGVRSSALKLYPGMTFTYAGTTINGG